MALAKLIISAKNYSAWALRGWLMTKMAGIEFEEEMISPEDPTMRAELLLLSPSTLVPCLIHEGITVWDTLAIGEYLNELCPKAGLLPKERAARARCRSVCGEMHSGFTALRSALPMSLRSHHPGFHAWAGAKADIERVTKIWRECLAAYEGPFLFGEKPTMADAMYAPVVTRFLTYDVKLDAQCAAYCKQIMSWPYMAEWVEEAKREPVEIAEFEVEF